MTRTREQKEKHAAYMRKYYTENKDQYEKVRARAKKWGQENKERKSIYMKQRHRANAEIMCEKSKKWYEQNKERHRTGGRDRAIKRITRDPSKGIAWYNGMCDRQGFLCEICHDVLESKKTGKAYALHIDHNHETDQVRDLLCGNCNTALGHAREREDILFAMIAYLRKHKIRAVQEQRRAYFNAA